MTPAARLAIGGAIGGLMLAVAIVSTMHQPTAPIAAAPVLQGEAAIAEEVDMARCRTITILDSDCDAAWEAKRQHFFGKDSGT